MSSPCLTVALHVHEAVAFPVQIGELGDDVAGDLRLQTHARDLVGEAARHVLLAGRDEVLEAAEDTVQFVGIIAVAHGMGIDNAEP